MKAEIYEGLINDMIERKVARKLTKEEMLKYKGSVFCHTILVLNKIQNQLRGVFNPSAKMFRHVINEYWAKGPNLLSNLLGILIRFLEEICAMIGDIKKMFHVIKFSVLDQNTHRFLWRNMNLEQGPEGYVMLPVSFGDKPSGGITIVALRRTAGLSRDQYPEAVQVLLNNMDDIINSFSTYLHTLNVSEDIDEVLK